MRATLFGVPASHPSLAAELMLRHKGIAYRRIDLVSGRAPAAAARARLPRQHRAGAAARRRKRPGHARRSPWRSTRCGPSRRCSRTIRSAGAPSSRPRPGATRSPAGAAAAVWAALKRDRSTIDTYLEGAQLGHPAAGRRCAPSAPVIAAAARRLNRATDENVRRDLAALPALLDRVDELLARGRDRRRRAQRRRLPDRHQHRPAADDRRLRPLIEGRPAGRHARRSRRATRATSRTCLAGLAAERCPFRQVRGPTVRQSTWKQQPHSGSPTSARSATGSRSTASSSRTTAPSGSCASASRTATTRPRRCATPSRSARACSTASRPAPTPSSSRPSSRGPPRSVQAEFTDKARTIAEFFEKQFDEVFGAERRPARPRARAALRGRQLGVGAEPRAGGGGRDADALARGPGAPVLRRRRPQPARRLQGRRRPLDQGRPPSAQTPRSSRCCARWASWRRSSRRCATRRRSSRRSRPSASAAPPRAAASRRRCPTRSTRSRWRRATWPRRWAT